ncbi:hypothetical protein Tco_1209087 [Tanacetum coccineum]
MSSSSTVTYTSVYTDFEPWRFQWVSNDELEAPEAAPQFLGQAPPSPDYVPGPEHPPSPNYEYLVPSDAKAPIEDQPLPDDASPTTLSPAYVADSDPEEDPVDYPANGGDDKDDESFGDDADDEDEEEASNEEDDDEEEEEHLALADSSAIHIDDPVPSAEDTKAFETDESAPTPPSPRPRMARISVRPQTPISAATEALIVAVVAALPSSLPPSLLTSLSSPPPPPDSLTTTTFVLLESEAIARQQAWGQALGTATRRYMQSSQHNDSGDIDRHRPSSLLQTPVDYNS